MTLPIISADERLKKTKGIKGCIFGKSGIGKTSLLWTLPAEKTLFFDLEAVIRRDKKDVDTGGVDLINLQPAILDRIPNAINPSYVSRILRLNLLAPQIKQAILDGTQPRSLSLQDMQTPFPDLWHEQLTHFRFE